MNLNRTCVMAHHKCFAWFVSHLSHTGTLSFSLSLSLSVNVPQYSRVTSHICGGQALSMNMPQYLHVTSHICGGQTLRPGLVGISHFRPKNQCAHKYVHQTHHSIVIDLKIYYHIVGYYWSM